MAGRVIFLGVDPSSGALDPEAAAVAARADEIVATRSIASMFGGYVVNAEQPLGWVEPLVDRAREGKSVVRAVVAAPLFDEATLNEIAEVSLAPVAMEVIPAAGAQRMPLFGKRILVTRALAQAHETVRALRRRGARALFLPTIEIGPPDDPSQLAAAVRALPTYDVVALTSANGVTALFDALDAAGLDARAFGAAKVAAIGPGTRVALEKRGIRPDLEPSEHRGEGLARAILEQKPKRVLVPRAAIAREVLPEMLRASGVHVDVVEAYRTRKPSPDAERTGRERLRALPPDAITFTSSSTVENFVAVFPDAASLLEGVVVASIGPITSETCRKLGLRVDVEASPYTIPALVDALETAFTSR